jgi:hypothetical protein
MVTHSCAALDVRGDLYPSHPIPEHTYGLFERRVRVRSSPARHNESGSRSRRALPNTVPKPS